MRRILKELGVRTWTGVRWFCTESTDILCGLGNGPSDSIKGQELLGQLDNNRLRSKDSGISVHNPEE
jgi:hypothetical protein